MGLFLPPKKITINLAPADIIKDGTHYDLPIALGILACMGIVDAEVIKNYIIIGELSLDGRINYVNGALPTVVYANEKISKLLPQVHA